MAWWQILLAAAYLACFPSFFSPLLATEYRLEHLERLGTRVTRENITPTGRDFVKALAVVWGGTFFVLSALLGLLAVVKAL